MAYVLFLADCLTLKSEFFNWVIANYEYLWIYEFSANMANNSGKKKSKNITLDGLARMVAKGFEETAKEKDMMARFDEVNERLDKIEKILFWEYKSRIEKLEDDVKELQSDFRQLVGLKK